MNARRRAMAAMLAAAAFAPAAIAQARPRLVGYLSNGADTTQLSQLLAERGHVEGRNLRFEFRLRPRNPREVGAVAKQLVDARPDVLVAFGAQNVGALARLTRTIPIVCGGTADPVGIGYAKSLRRPGGNITGLSYGVPEFAQITIGLMRAVRPRLRRIAAIVSRTTGNEQEGWKPINRSMEEASLQEGVAWELTPVGSLAELERVLGALQPATGIPYFINLSGGMPVAEVAGITNRRRLASATSGAELARAGVLMHYSLDHADSMRRVAAIVDQLLGGADPAEIPFELPDRTTFIVNRATAKVIGVELPPEVLARATEIVG